MWNFKRYNSQINSSVTGYQYCLDDTSMTFMRNYSINSKWSKSKFKSFYNCILQNWTSHVERIMRLVIFPPHGPLISV